MNQYKAYANATMTVAKTRQVVMLYDAAIRNVQQAIEAIEKKDIQTRFNTISKAADIMFGLQGSLDFEQGGEVSKILFDFYTSMDARLLNIHSSNSIDECKQVIKEMKMMRDAWAEIDANHTEETTGGTDQIVAPTTPPASAQATGESDVPQDESSPASPTSGQPPIDTSGGVAISA